MKAERAETEKKMVFETIAVAQAISQSIETVLEMGIDAYNYVVSYLEEQAKSTEGTEDLVKTLG